MGSKISPLQDIVIASHPQIPDAITMAGKISQFLKNKGKNIHSGLLHEKDLREKIEQRKTDLLIALGGDGTMLRAGHLCGPYDVPIVGINLGKFGFLTEIKINQWEETLPKLFNDEYWIEKRMMLHAEHYREEKVLGEWSILNEIVISRGKIVRPIHIDAHVDERHLTTFVADGLIAATPTGSTAYALAVGGPILPPELRNILLVPIAPHLSIDRAIVLAEGSKVSIKVKTDHQAVISIDGHNPINILSNDYIQVRTSRHNVRFVRFQDPGYFYRNLTPHMNRNPSIGIST